MAGRERRTITLHLRGPITRSDLPGLCRRVRRVLERSDAELAICDVAHLDPDAVCVDALARLQLAARRAGCRVSVRHASTALCELVALMGLEDVLVD